MPKRKIEAYSDSFRQKILDANLPLEAIMKETLVTSVGQSELWIENYKALLEYKEEKILIQADKYMVCIEGEHLIISHYMEEHMMVCGKIRSIIYM